MTLFILAILGLLVSFYLLNEITDRYFVKSLDAIAEHFNMSDDAAGATLMAAGSSAPELFIAIVALLYGGENMQIGAGTIVGSALFNLLMILGVVGLMKKAKLIWQPMFRDFLFYLLSILLLFWAFRDGQIRIFEVVIFVSFYALYVLAVIFWRRIMPYTEPVEEKAGEDEEDDDNAAWKKIFRPLDIVLEIMFLRSKNKYVVFLISIMLIALLSWFLVESAVIISEFLGVPSYVIALTVLAVGTSLPDMISSMIVARQGRGGMAASNALGSNIFDILIGLGFPWLVAAILHGKGGFTVLTENLDQHILFLIFSIVGVFGFLILAKWRLNRFLGVLFTGSYIAYVLYLIIYTTTS
jgi:K+-dependent Na+/Ca+ exchanger-like protein